MRVQLSKAILAFSIASALGLFTASVKAQPQQPAAQAKAQPSQAQPSTTPAQKSWKDRQEYDLVQSIDAATDPNKKLALLDQWTAKYPNTDFKTDRLLRYLDTYKALNQPQKMLDTAQQMLAVDPGNLQALYWINLLTVSMNDKTPAKLDLGQTSGNELLAAADAYFAPEKKPANNSDADWAKAKASVQTIAHRTLGWVAMQRGLAIDMKTATADQKAAAVKDYEEAEKQFEQVLQLNPADGEVSAWLGTEILNQVIYAQKVDRQSDALYEFARAAAYDGPGALPPDQRKRMLDYLTKSYATYHGDDPQGLQALLAQAKTSALPPPGFKILSSDEVQQAKQEELQKTNPALAMWMTIKTALTAPDGSGYFKQIEGALVPPTDKPMFKGTVISQMPLHGPVKQVVVGVADPKVPDCTLNFETPMPNRAEPGKTVIEFRGVAAAYTPSPYMLTLTILEKGNVSGWPAPPAPVHHPVHHPQQ